ncbi:unnamed protein product, partial [Oppiella nova]
MCCISKRTLKLVHLYVFNCPPDDYGNQLEYNMAMSGQLSCPNRHQIDFIKETVHMSTNHMDLIYDKMKYTVAVLDQIFVDIGYQYAARMASVHLGQSYLPALITALCYGPHTQRLFEASLLTYWVKASKQFYIDIVLVIANNNDLLNGKSLSDLYLDTSTRVQCLTLIEMQSLFVSHPNLITRRLLYAHTIEDLMDDKLEAFNNFADSTKSPEIFRKSLQNVVIIQDQTWIDILIVFGTKFASIHTGQSYLPVLMTPLCYGPHFQFTNISQIITQRLYEASLLQRWYLTRNTFYIQIYKNIAENSVLMDKPLTDFYAKTVDP